MILDVLVSIRRENIWLAPSVRPKLCVHCGLFCRDVCNIEDCLVLAEGSFHSTGDGVDVGGFGGNLECGDGVLGGVAAANLIAEIGNLTCSVVSLSVNVMEYPVGSGASDTLGEAVMPSKLEFESCVKRVR